MDFQILLYYKMVSYYAGLGIKLVSRLENLCEKIASLSDLEKLVSLVLKMKDNLTTWKLEIAVFNCLLCLNSPVRIFLS